jgi:hypothetical protein
MTLACAPAILYSKKDVLSCMGITQKEFNNYMKIGVIPPPDGREGNAYRWNSNVIKAIALSKNMLGIEHTHEQTLDILLKRLEFFEAGTLVNLEKVSNNTADLY